MRSLNKTIIIFAFIIFAITKQGFSWGFYVHRVVNRHAVFTLPPEMFGFFKSHIEYLTEHAVDPDKRSFMSEKEAVRHYIDIDHYGENPFELMPQKWNDAIAKFSEDTLQAYGINPWHIQIMMFRLTKAFEEKNVDDILFNAANIGHYIGDATVPLHTSQYYDGKKPEHKGIHAFWETGIPELLAGDYNYLVGRAHYIKNPLKEAWRLVKESHYEVDTIFAVLDYMNANFPEDKKYSFINKGQVVLKAYSREYATEFSLRMNNMVERKMQTAIKAVGSFWYTAWVNAGQPNLLDIEGESISKKLEKEILQQDSSFNSGKILGRHNPAS